MAAIQERSKASGEQADSMSASLKERMAQLQAELDKLQQQRDDALTQSAAHVKAEVIPSQICTLFHTCACILA